MLSQESVILIGGGEIIGDCHRGTLLVGVWSKILGTSPMWGEKSYFTQGYIDSR